MNQVRIGFYGILAAGVGVLLLPLVMIVANCMEHDVSFSAVMREPESRGMTTLYYLVAFVLHLPMAAILAVFAYTLRRGSLRAVRVWYVLALLATTFSAVFYVWFGFPRVKYIPPALYALVLLPLLTQSLLARVKAQKSARQQHE